MNCPRCHHTVLGQREHEGISIDVCARCRGIWLDRGELEKLIARAARDYDDVPRRDSTPPRGTPRYSDEIHDYDGRHPRRQRRWYETLGDLFD